MTPQHHPSALTTLAPTPHPTPPPPCFRHPHAPACSYVGGSFTYSAWTPTRGLARWVPAAAAWVEVTGASMRTAGDAVTSLAVAPDALYVGTNTWAPGGLACTAGVVRLDTAGSVACVTGPAGDGTLVKPSYPAAMAVVGGELYVGLAGQPPAGAGGMCTTYAALGGGGNTSSGCYFGLVQFSPSRGAWMPAYTFSSTSTPAGTGSAASPVLALRANATSFATQLYVGGRFNSLYGATAGSLAVTLMSPSASSSPSSSPSWSNTPSLSATLTRVSARRAAAASFDGVASRLDRKSVV